MMKNLTTTFLLLMTTIWGYAQCSQINLATSSSTETVVQLYHPGFFLIPNGFDNVVDWIVTDNSGTIIHQETTTGAWAEQSFSIFTHNVPLTEQMNVDVTITNTTAGIVCNISDILTWTGNIANWEMLNGNVGVLPVELLEFNARLSGNKISLNWKTASEVNNLGFELQKSSNSKDWETIEFVKGQGNSTQLNSYQSEDDSPHNGINYYRLKQMDIDGQFAYSNIDAVEYRNANSEVVVFPNPSTGDLNIKISNTESQDVELQIVDTQGRVIWQTNAKTTDGNWNENIQIESNGLYFITIKTGDEIRQEKLIVQR